MELKASSSHTSVKPSATETSIEKGGERKEIVKATSLYFKQVAFTFSESLYDKPARTILI